MRSWRELHGDEDGASMVFAAITMLTLAISIMFVFQVSLVSTDKIQMQNAADAAAGVFPRVRRGRSGANARLRHAPRRRRYASILKSITTSKRPRRSGRSARSS